MVLFIRRNNESINEYFIHNNGVASKLVLENSSRLAHADGGNRTYTAPPPSRSTVQHTNHCATAPFPKRMVWTQFILCAVYRDTVLSPDVTTVTAQH